MARRLTQQEREWRETPERGHGGVQESVKEAAETLGWKYAHFNDARRQVRRQSGHSFTIGDKDAKGFPDTTLCRGGEIVFVECKRELKDPEPEQEEWLRALAASGAEVWVVRPSNLQELIERLARRLVRAEHPRDVVGLQRASDV